MSYLRYLEKVLYYALNVLLLMAMRVNYLYNSAPKIMNVNNIKGVTMSQETALLAECNSESPEALRNSVRQQLSSDVEAFLQRGGQVQQIDDNVRADPPKKPTMNYGSAPI